MKEKTHWKKLYNPNYMGSYSFAEGEVKNLKISQIKVEPVTGRDGKPEDCTVIYFEGNEKPLICNKTNAKAIAHVTKSNYIEDWIGVTIQLIVREVKAFGDMVDAVRVSLKSIKQKVKQKKTFDESNENWDAAIKSLELGQYTIEAFKSNYQIPAGALKKLEEAAKKATNEGV